MSTSVPTLSPFVRGTTSSAVYYLQSGQARFVPDDATLSFMANGQTVRTLSDADLKAIPQGTPLPSRADGNIVMLMAPTRANTLETYLMLGGLRRHIPDVQTVAIFQKSGSQTHSITPADLAAIPLGTALPSRADGTVYQGDSTTFAFLMKDGKRSAVPDATTLRDAGHEISTLQSISASDLELIPAGPALPSTSKFLQPPPAATPLLLLPIRLETRFQGSELWLRVYPDDVHINSFEPELTAEETTARSSFFAIDANNSQSRQDAFTRLAQQYGRERAAWIVSADAKAGAKASSWTRAPFTNVLPERWIVMGYQTDGPGQLLAIGSPIVDSLPVGPDPKGPGPATDDGMRWLADFDRAVQAGMALRIPLTPPQTRGFKRLLVFGVRSQLQPAEAAARFGDLLQAHHYTDGLELLRHGAPTNNTEDASSAFSSHDLNYKRLFALEQGAALCPARPTADGDRLARAAGFAPALLAHVSGANGAQDEQAAAMNTVLWPATWGYYLEQIVNGAVPIPETLLPLARDHFATYVRARGHFPILRVGSQPYGVLPVLWSARWKALENRALDTPLMGLLASLRTAWESSVANVPQIHGAADPEAALVSLLGMEPRSSSYAARNVIGPEYNLTFWRFIQQDPGQAWWTSLNNKALAQTGNLANALKSTRLANATYVNQHRLLTDILVAPAPLDGVPAPSYLAQLRSLTWQALRDLPTPAQPVPLLLLLLRHAALRQYLDTAAELLTKADAAQPSERIEAELIGLSVGLPRPTPWDLLERTLPGKGAVGAYLDGSKGDASIPDFTAFWAAFDSLITMSAEDLDSVTREVMDLASYRLDAWLTSMAYFRLDQLRAATPDGGVFLGAYGWLEDVRPQNAVASSGYVHAPSLAHATTAAVLRSAYLTHKGSAQSPLQIDLSSTRVRLALHLLEGMRERQPLGALLGYRLERSMHDTGLETLIKTLRTIAPLNVTVDTSTTTSESVAANNTVDGLALLRAIFPDGTLATGFDLPTDTGIRAKLTTALRQLNDALDTVADLSLAESVHQLLRGNTVRAGATLDAIARGDAPPPDLDVIETPRAGTAFTHRLFTIASGTAAPGWVVTPRAKAEPRLNAWAAAMFPDPTRIHARASFVDATGTPITSIEFDIAKLALAPLDLLALPETDGFSGELASRLLLAASAARPASVPASATITLLPGRDSAWAADTISVTEFLEVVSTLGRLLSGARPMTPGDLVAPGSTPGGIDTAELQARADAAEAQLRSVALALQGSSVTEQVLLDAAGFGIADAIPSLTTVQWGAQATSALVVIKARIAALDKLASSFTRTGANADALRDQDVSRQKIIFGDSFVVMPALDAALGTQWNQLWSNSVALQGGDPLASTTWLQRMARIRPGVSRLHMAMLYAEAFSDQTLPLPAVAQLPLLATTDHPDRWVALDKSPNPSTSRLSLVAFSPQPAAAGAGIAGLIVDEWVEVLPSAQQITGVSFHQDDPTSRAPQAILLAVRPDDFPEWTMESVEGTLLEALDLAKLRAVDPDALNGPGHYLPALYFAYNAGGPKVDTISTDFNIAQAPAALSRSN